MPIVRCMQVEFIYGAGRFTISLPHYRQVSS